MLDDCFLETSPVDYLCRSCGRNIWFEIIWGKKFNTWWIGSFICIRAEYLDCYDQVVLFWNYLKSLCFADFFPEYIDPLISQAMEWCDSYTFPLLVPLTKWLDSIHVPLVTSMSMEEPVLCATVMPNSQHILLATSKSIHMYHIPTKRLVKSFHGR